jgi:hypothetical protein
LFQEILQSITDLHARRAVRMADTGSPGRRRIN